MTYPSTELLIDGQWRPALDGKTIPVVNPATGEEIGRVAKAGTADLDQALAAAQKGFVAWRKVSAFDRRKILRAAADLMRARAEETATNLTREQGKPFVEARMETLAAADIIDWFADEGMRVYGRIVPSRNAAVTQTVLKDPVGPVAAFTPWNFPINQVVRKTAAALACGCSILVKAAEETPAAPAALIRAFVDAGVPSGAVGLVYGDPAEISAYLIPHPVIRKITFTGSTAVGKQLAALAGLHMKRATMELGGHAPVIIAEDADLDLAIKIAGGGKFRNAGQVCISPTRYLVHESLHQSFAEGFARLASGLKVGDGLDKASQMGPLANPRRLTAMQDFTRDAEQKGAKILAGGERIGNAGNFFAPTVISNAPLDSRVMNEEPFGPLAIVNAYRDLDDAIAEANRLPYGLSSYAFTRSLKTAHRLSHELETGMLWVNQPPLPTAEMPFGGVKDSGYGTEGGPEAMEAYLNTRAIAVTNI